MTGKMVLEVLMQVVGGLGLFLVGMKYMSEGMQAVAGNRLRKMISAVTDKRILACLIGTLITGLVQSSSVTTVMVVGFVNSGFMTLMQSLGVILGANIGTTITAWIIALKIGKFGLPLLGFSSFFFLFAKRDRVRYTALTLLGVGMVFYGLQTMGAAFKTPEVKHYLNEVFAVMDATTYLGVLKCALFGCVATMIVQSSSATIGITIVLAQGGIIGFDAAAALVLGLNIGTTVTAFLASIGTSTNAKRAAWAHIIFNVVGTLWMIPFFFLYVKGINSLFGVMEGFFAKTQEHWDDVTAKIAMVHTGFNVINAIVFLPLMGQLCRLVTWLIPEKGKEIAHLTYLDIRMIETPAFGIQQSQIEVTKMTDHVLTMSHLLGSTLEARDNNEEIVRKLFHREEVLDDVQREVTVFLSELLSGNVTHEVMNTAREQLRMADELESVGDYYAMVMKRLLKLEQEGITLKDEALSDLMAVHERTEAYVSMVSDAVRENFTDILSKAASESAEITHLVKAARQRHLERISSEADVSPFKSLAFTDMLQAYRKIKDHMLNVAEALAGEK